MTRFVSNMALALLWVMGLVYIDILSISIPCFCTELICLFNAFVKKFFFNENRLSIQTGNMRSPIQPHDGCEYSHWSRKCDIMTLVFGTWLSNYSPQDTISEKSPKHHYATTLLVQTVLVHVVLKYFLFCFVTQQSHLTYLYESRIRILIY